jgi:O-antigen/teichoic acid export membrane protein
MLEHSAGEQTLGIFSAVATISAGIGLLYSAVGQTALPRLAKMFASDRKKFDTTILQMMLFSCAVGTPIIVAAWFWGVRAVKLAYGQHSLVTKELVVGLVIVGVLSNTSSLLGAAVTASRRFWPQLAVACMVLAVIALACVRLIPSMGAMGAMYASLVGAALQTVAYATLCRKS